MTKETPKGLKFRNKNILYKDEDMIAEYYCDNVAQCSGETPTESNPSGCHGCEGQDEFIEWHYDKHTIDESKEKEFISLKDCRDLLQEQAKQNISLIDNKIEKVKQRTGHNKRQKRIIINALNSIKKQMGD